MSAEEKKVPEHKSYFQNWFSVAGGILSVFFFVVILFLFVLDFRAKNVNPYLGAVTYFFAPACLVLSLLLIPIGALGERKLRYKRGYVRRFPQIDFNNPKHQKLAFSIIGISTLFLLFTMVGSYKAYEFTESVTFCGKLCHQVMAPEYTAYHNSPHARVACVQCHIGPGVDWFVRSKLSGSYQIYSVIAKKYSKPIGTPVKNLRPAQETCEQCHWPQQFFGAIEQDHHYFLSDETNTEWQTKMLMFVGGGTPRGQGIHWHMNINNKVNYIATDDKRQVIPWVKRTGPDGKEEIYVDETSGFSAENAPKGEIRRMDCVDCHNRPSHIYRSPDRAVNEALAYGNIDRTLPFIKREAVKALTGSYASHNAAEVQIKKQLEEFYKKNYSEVSVGKKNEIDRSAHAVVQIYKTNFFPQMNVSWNAYPDNIGHMIFSGCFRCHDGKHKTSDGKMIRNDCNTCHSIILQGKVGEVPETAVNGLEFKHPEEIGTAWKETSCTDCHTGG